LYGWVGKVLNADLTRERMTEEPLGAEFAKAYLGGRGINVRRLYDLIKPGIDPLGPENVLIFGVGPLAGTLAPAAGRFNVSAKSPQTDIIGDGNCGGFFGPELKFAGYDQIIIHGVAKKPVYLWINDGEAELKDAGSLWGSDTWDTQKTIRKELGDERVQIAAIGQAGEKLVRIATIAHGIKRQIGRCGLGAVMGSKKLKAVAVRGTRSIEVAQPREFERVCEEIYDEATHHPFAINRGKYGTSLIVEWSQEVGQHATRNWSTPILEYADDIGGVKLREDFTVKMRACFGCPSHCTPFAVVREGKYAGTYCEGPEFQTLGAFGAVCGCRDLAAIMKINSLANRYGVSTSCLGVIIGWAIDCFKRGLITEKETGGLKLDWGDPELLIDLVKKTANREGFGNILAEGEKRAPKIVGKGTEKFIYHAKGMAIVPQDPRAVKLSGLAWVTSTRGGDHLRGGAYLDVAFMISTAEKLHGIRDVADPIAFKGKGKVLPWHENFATIIDAAGLCKFVYIQFLDLLNAPDKVARLISTATGWEMDKQKLLGVGERIFNVEKAFNTREGLTRKDDNWSVPEKFNKEPLKEGPCKGSVFELDQMLDEYYERRGWDVKTGLQTKAKLEELGLKDIADELERMGKLPK